MHQDIFCNTPWFELHVYWDGSLGNCCQEYHKLYPDTESSRYNIVNMSIQEWHHSEVMNRLRLEVLGTQKVSSCARCYNEEQDAGTSRRHRANQKSVIFTRTAFSDSLEQSPHYTDFKYSQDHQGATTRLPVELHVDLGNYCNLACKMCNAKASSRIATQEIKWGITESEKYLKHDWTKNTEVWNRFLSDVLAMPIKNIHFMGGETILTNRFHEFLDFMIAHQRFDLNISFVSNGTKFDPALIEKLKQFGRVGIEISMESVTDHNTYQRQGTDTPEVLKNIDLYLEHCDNTNITVTMRPAVSALSIGSFPSLLRFCLEKQITIKALKVLKPDFLNADNIPWKIRQTYLPVYQELADDYGLDQLDTAQDFNESDPHQYKRMVKVYWDMAVGMLHAPTNSNHRENLQALVDHCAKWDKIYGYDARVIYPELAEIFSEYGYAV